MTEMVERVARAILRARHRTCCEGRPIAEFRPSEFDRDEARAAIAVMEIPTEGMLRAAFVEMNKTPSGTWKAMKAANETPRALFDAKMVLRFTAMISAALKD